FSSRRRHTRCLSDWSSDVCSSDLKAPARRWAAFAIRPGTADLSMTDCTVTIEGVAQTSAVVAILPGDPLEEERLPAVEPAPATQIGRASCRERVERMVGAAAVNTK